MELIKLSLGNCNVPSNIVACIGEFDGVHIAHQRLIEEVIKLGKSKNLKTGIITFDPHPDFILNKSYNEEYITPHNHKLDILNDYLIDYFIVIEFTKELSNLTYDLFYDKFLKGLNTIVIGYDFKFGNKGLGNSTVLKQMHNNVVVIDKISINDKKIGTQNIINCLKKGEVALANNMLGRFYKIKGTVIKGSQIGNKIGYPTANVDITEKYCVIKKGVYAVRVLLENKYYLGIANYGINPSFNEIEKPRLEVHIFDFNKDIYYENIDVEFLEYIRDEVKFNGVDEFLLQLNKDCNYCINKYGGIYETINCWSNGVRN